MAVDERWHCDVRRERAGCEMAFSGSFNVSSETVVILIAGLMCVAVILNFHLSMRLSLVIE